MERDDGPVLDVGSETGCDCNDQAERSTVRYHLDRMSPSMIEGWVCDRLGGDDKVALRIDINDKHVWSGIADVFRQDLAEAGIGDGNHAFTAMLPDFSDLELPHSITISRADSGEIIIRQILPGIDGALDDIDGALIRGWAFDFAAMRGDLLLELVADGERLRTFRANDLRADLFAAGIGDGRCAFNVETPAALLDGKPHEVGIRPANGAYHLRGSPRIVRIEANLPSRSLAHVRDIIANARTQIDEMANGVGAGPMLAAQQAALDANDYARWFERFGIVTPEQRRAMHERIMAFDIRPKFSIIMPVYNTPPAVLDAAIVSVQAQIYPNWELCISDDCSTDAATRDYLKRLDGADFRIKIAFRAENGHISRNTNTALSLADGDYAVFLDHDDLLSEDALFHLTRVLNAGRFDILYSDEDKIDEGDVHFGPHFKPEFNRTLLLSYNYFCHLLCIKRTLVDTVGGLRVGFEGAQDYDLVLRCIEATEAERIGHIPLVLYHWRSHAGSTAWDSETKGYAIDAGRRAIDEHLRRTSPGCSVDLVPGSGYRVRWPLPADEPLVSIVVPTRDQSRILAACLAGILSRTHYRNIELIVIDNGSVEAETQRVFDEARRDGRVKILSYAQPFNYAAICNFGVAAAKGGLVLLLNNDIEVIDANWLTEMVSQILRPGVAAVGAKLLYADGRTQHAGVVLGIGGVAGHAHKRIDGRHPGYMSRAILAQELSACTAACLLVRKDLYEQVSGLNEEHLPISFNDVDLCLKLRAAGGTIIFSPHAVLYHHESLSRGVDETPSKILRSQAEIAYMRKHWADTLDNDPHYSPNLTMVFEDFRVDPSRGVDRDVGLKLDP